VCTAIAVGIAASDVATVTTVSALVYRLGARLGVRSEVPAAGAAVRAPSSTRAFLRGGLIAAFGERVPAAGWDGIVLDAGGELVRLPTLHPGRATEDLVGALLAASTDPDDFLRRLEEAAKPRRGD